METSIKSAPLERIFPIMGLIDGVIISKRGDITIGWELEFPSIGALDEGEYEDLISKMGNGLRALAAGMTIGAKTPWIMMHRQDRFTPTIYEPCESDGFLNSSYERHFKGRSYLKHSQFIFITLASRSSALLSSSASGTLGIYPSASIPKREELLLFESKAQEFIEVMCTGSIRFRRLGTDEIGSNGGLIQESIYGTRNPLLSGLRWNDDRIISADRDMIGFVINDAEYTPAEISACRRIDSLSSTASDVHMSFGANIGVLLDCEHTVNHYIVLAPQQVIMNELERRKRRMEAMSSNSAENRINAQGLGEFMESVHKDQFTVVYSHLNVLAWSRPENMQEIKGKVSSALQSMNMVGVQELRDMPVLWMASIPGAACEIGADNLMLMELNSALCMSSNEGFMKEVDGGKMKICDRFRHIPLRIDMQKAARELGWIDNYNAFILGPSGSGKSFFMNSYLRNCYDSGENVFVIDVGDSYEVLCSLIHEESGGCDGHYHTWDTEHPFSFHPFVGCQDWLDDNGHAKPEESGFNFIISFLKTAWSPKDDWNAENENILTSIVENFLLYAKKQGESYDPVFDDFYQYLDTEVTQRIKWVDKSEKYREYAEKCMIQGDEANRKKWDELAEEEFEKTKLNAWWIGNVRIESSRFDIDSLKVAIDAYKTGNKFGFLLNNKTAADLFSSRFVIFEVNRLSQIDDKKFYSLCILCIMQAFDRKMRESHNFTVMVIEEAWKAIANETMAPYLKGLWKTARKYQTSAVVVTQEAEDIVSSDIIKNAIIQNSSVKILLDQSRNQNCFDGVTKLLGLSPKQVAMALSINKANNPRFKYKEVFISLGDKWNGVFATEVSKEEALAYESEKELKKPLLQKYEELGSMKEAIISISRNS